MKLLITAPTWKEIQPLEKAMAQWETEGRLHHHGVDFSITGIGGTATAYHLTKKIAPSGYDLAIQLGVCGSFDDKLPKGSVVCIAEERFADLGAEDGDQFLDAFEIGLLEADKFPFRQTALINPTSIESATLHALPRVRGISVNRVHGHEATIMQAVKKFQPQVESMEGAAFFYCCLMESQPFLEIRSVSNIVKRRNKSEWDLSLAISRLNETAIALISELLEERPA